MRTRTKLHIPGASFKLGDLVKAEISGFVGIASCHSRHLTGCDTIWVTSRTETHEGNSIQRCFDVTELLLISTNPMNVAGFPEDVPPAG